MTASEAVERILEDCRGAIGEVRFGFGTKRQVWAFEDRHHLDCPAMLESLRRQAPLEFLGLAVRFHDEFSTVNSAWTVRERIDAIAAELCREGAPAVLERVVGELVDERLAVRHWLLSAFLAGPPQTVFEGLLTVLGRAYQPADLSVILTRLQTVAARPGWTFGEPATSIVGALAQFSARAEDRQRALEMLARFGGPGSSAALANAARGDADPAVRAGAAELLRG